MYDIWPFTSLFTLWDPLPTKQPEHFLALSLFDGFQIAFRLNFTTLREVYKSLHHLILPSLSGFISHSVFPGSLHFDHLRLLSICGRSRALSHLRALTPAVPTSWRAPLLPRPLLYFLLSSSPQLLNATLSEKPPLPSTSLRFSHSSSPFLRVPCFLTSIALNTICMFPH